MLDRWITDNEPSPTYPIYTRANAGEVYPDPVTPMSGTLQFLRGGEPGWRDAYLRYMMRPDEFDMTRAEIIGCFGGYLFLNMSLTRMFGVRMPGMTPEQVDFQYFGEMPGIPPYLAREGDEDADRSAALGGWVNEFLAADDLPELREHRAEVDAIVGDRPDLRSLTDRQLVDRMRSLVPLYRPLFEEHITISAASGVGAGIVAGVAQALEDPTLTMRLMADIGDVDSAAPSWAMWDLGREVASSPALTTLFDEGIAGLDDRLRGAIDDPDVDHFCKGFDEFLDEHGCRGPNEWEFRSPTWGTKPDLPLAAIDRMRRMAESDSPQANRERRAADAAELAGTVEIALADDPETLAQFRGGLSAGRLHMQGRERTKTTIIRLVHEQRLAARELGRRAVDAGLLDTIEQIFMLKDDELDEYILYPAAWTDVLRERERNYLELFALEPPFIVVGEVPPLSEWKRRDRTDVEPIGVGDSLVGIPGCPGTATGRARVILDPADPTALEPGDVLVAPITDPAWTPLFVPASAVIVDVGAQISHAVIVSRELGIPCVVSVTDATHKIPDGATVTVDGTNGTVTVDSL